MTVQNSSSVKVVSNFGSASEVEEYIIDSNTSTQELICIILRRHGMTSRDPNLFYLTLEGWNNNDSVNDTITVYNDSRPLMMQTANQNCRFLMHMRAGGLVKIFDSCLMSGSHYKSLFISKKTATRDVIGLLLSSYHMKESVDNFIIVDKRAEEEKVLKPYDYPLVIYQSGQKLELHLRRISNLFGQRKVEHPISTPPGTRKTSARSLYGPKNTEKSNPTDSGRENSTINRLKDSFRWLQKKRTDGPANGVNQKLLETKDSPDSPHKSKIEELRLKLPVEDENPPKSGLVRSFRISSCDNLGHEKNEVGEDNTLSLRNIHNFDSHFVCPVPRVQGNPDELREAPSHIPVYVRNQVPQIHHFDKPENCDLNGNHVKKPSSQTTMNSARESKPKENEKFKHQRMPNSARAPFERNSLTKSYRPQKAALPSDNGVSSLRRTTSLRITNTQEQPFTSHRQSMIEGSASNRTASQNSAVDLETGKKGNNPKSFHRVVNRENNSLMRASSFTHKPDKNRLGMQGVNTHSQHRDSSRLIDQHRMVSPPILHRVDNDRSFEDPSCNMKSSCHQRPPSKQNNFNGHEDDSSQKSNSTGYVTMDSDHINSNRTDNTMAVSPESLMSLPSPKDVSEFFLPLDHEEGVNTVIRRNKRKPWDIVSTQSRSNENGRDKSITPTNTSRNSFIRRNSSLSKYSQNFVSGWATKISASTQTVEEMNKSISPNRKSPKHPSLFEVARCSRIFHVTLVRQSRSDSVGIACVESLFANPYASLHPLPGGRRPTAPGGSDSSHDSAFMSLSSSLSEYNHQSVTAIDHIVPGSLSDGVLKTGDVLLEVNGISVIDKCPDRVDLLLNSSSVLDILAARLWSSHNGHHLSQEKSLECDKDLKEGSAELDNLMLRIGQLEQDIQVKDRLLAELQTVLSKKVKVRHIAANKSDQLLNIHNCFAIIKNPGTN